MRKLDEEDQEMIYYLVEERERLTLEYTNRVSGLTNKALAKKFGVFYTTISVVHKRIRKKFGEDIERPR